MWLRRIVHLRKIMTIMAVTIVCILLYISIIETENSKSQDHIPVLHSSHVPGMKGYLVWSEWCKIPNIDPYQPDVMKFFKRKKYKPCSTQISLTNLAYSEAAQRYVISIDEDFIPWYSKSSVIECCYQIIERIFTGIFADNIVNLSDCITFRNSTVLAPHIDNILAKCHYKKRQIYVNGYAMMPERPDLRKRLDAWRLKDKQQKRHRPPSILMIGIDSISRLNLIRAMPITAQYLYTNEWFEMSGYNKINDNTLPNLMAILAGFNKTHANLKCSLKKLNGLDNCNFIWDTFRDHGYVTAFGEDETKINTFNYGLLGFEYPPVDYYLRPFLLSAEKHLRVKIEHSMKYCLGYQHSADFVYDYAIELARRYKNDPYFGIFWSNTFSHNGMSDCSAMDEKMLDYLKRFTALGKLGNTILIFLSDHGTRFGPSRTTYSGHLEERLPFLFIWLPEQLKRSHPEFVTALSTNKNRLTSPFDLHMTLKHVLRMSGRVKDSRQIAPAEDCTSCQTLFKPISNNRSCIDAAIADHWCTCIPYESVYKNSQIMQNIATLTVNYINQYITDLENSTFAKLCRPLQLQSVKSAHRAWSKLKKLNTKRSINTYRLIFQTKPNSAIFEATVQYGSPTNADSAPIFKVSGEISRLNSYVRDSFCISNTDVKKYCSCDTHTILTSAAPTTYKPNIFTSFIECPKITGTVLQVITFFLHYFLKNSMLKLSSVP